MKSKVRAGIRIAQTGKVEKVTKTDHSILSEINASHARIGSSYTLSHYEQAALRNILTHHYGVPEADLLPDAQQASGQAQTRTEALERSNDEKSGTAAVFSDTVMIRPQPGRPMTMGAEVYDFPNGMSLHVKKGMAELLSTKGVILVENKEVFQRFEDLMFEVPKAYQDYLLVFRGEPHIAPQNAAEDFLRALDVPVVVFSDFDPAGIVIALRAPGSRGMLVPPLDLFERRLEERGNRENFFKQAGFRRICDEGVHGDMVAIWKMMKSCGKGVVQEAFLKVPD